MPDSMLDRWIENLKLFEIEIKYRPGRQIADVEALSRTKNISYIIMSAVQLEGATEVEFVFL